MIKRLIASLGLSALLVVSTLSFAMRGVQAAGSASLFLSPASGSVNGTSGQISVDIHVDSGVTQINAVQSDLSYNPCQLGVVSVNIGSGWSQAQNDTSTPGTILFAAFPSPAGSSTTGDQNIATVVFQSKFRSGSSAVPFANSSAFLETSDNADILTTKTGGSYSSTTFNNIYHSCGALVKPSGSSAVYSSENGTKRPFTAANIYQSYGNSWGAITTMTSADNALPTGADMPFREGTIIKGTGGGIFVVDNSTGSSQKHAFSDWSTFTGLGYSLNDVLSVTDAQLSAISTASAISNTSAHPAGTLVKSNGDPTIYLTTSTSKRKFVDQYTFASHGYSFGSVKTATSADLALSSGADMVFKAGTVIKGSGGAIYAADVASGVSQKRGFNSWTTFTGLGYSLSQVMTVPDSVLPSTNGPTI